MLIYRHDILLSTLTSVASDLLNDALRLDNELSAWAATCSLYPLYTGAATFLPPLCDHKTGQVAVEGRKEAERLPWSLNGGTQDVQTSPWTPWSPRSFEHVQNSRTKVAEEVGRSQVARRRQEEGTHIAMVAEWMHSGRPLASP